MKLEKDMEIGEKYSKKSNGKKVEYTIKQKKMNKDGSIVTISIGKEVN